MNTSIILTDLKAKGHRITKARAAMVEMFVLHTAPLTAKDVEDYFEKRKLSVNKATIYRELTFLLEEQILHIVHLSPDILYYELSGRKHHHHVVCTSCGKIEDINVKREETLIDAVAQKTNFRIDSHSLEFFGHCNNCR